MKRTRKIQVMVTEEEWLQANRALNQDLLAGEQRYRSLSSYLRFLLTEDFNYRNDDGTLTNQ